MPQYGPFRYLPMPGPRKCAAFLEALVREQDPRRKQGMWRKMDTYLTIASSPAAWIAGASRLRDRRVISQALYSRLIDAFVMHIEPSDAELERLDAEARAIERAHGLTDDDVFRAADEPPEYTALQEAYWRRHDDLAAAWLRARGYMEAATLVELNEAEYDRQVDQGHAELWGPGGPPAPGR